MYNIIALTIFMFLQGIWKKYKRDLTLCMSNWTGGLCNIWIFWIPCLGNAIRFSTLHFYKRWKYRALQSYWHNKELHADQYGEQVRKKKCPQYKAMTIGQTCMQWKSKHQTILIIKIFYFLSSGKKGVRGVVGRGFLAAGEHDRVGSDV